MANAKLAFSTTTSQETLQPLSQNTNDFISRITKELAYGGDPGLLDADQLPAVSMRELFCALRNSRKLAREVDRARLLDENNAEEFKVLRKMSSESAKSVFVRVMLALIEKAVNALTGSSSRLNAYAAFFSYSKECSAAYEIMELSGNEIWMDLLAEQP